MMTKATQMKKKIHILKNSFKNLAISTFILNLCLGSSCNTIAVDAQIIPALNQEEVRLLHAGESYRFVDSENNPIANASFNKDTLKTRLNLAKETYNTAIDNIRKNAYRELKAVIAPHISEKYINAIFENFLDENIVHMPIDITGLPAMRNERKFLNDYMIMSDAAYTDFTTRPFLMKQDLAVVGKKLVKVASRLKEITRLIEKFTAIRNNQDILSTRNPISRTSGSLLCASVEIPALSREILDPDIEKNYRILINDINLYLKNINRENEIIADEEIEPINILEKLQEIQKDIEEDYKWYFETNSNKTLSWKSNIDSRLELDNIPTFENQHLTPKAVIGLSFLRKSRLINKNNITLIDVGFRNATRYGSYWNEFVTNRMRPNAEAWFNRSGEVDYIAYIEKDSSSARNDKLVIVYSGSNSAIDWGLNLTLGVNEYLGLAVHQGIGWLSEMGNKLSHTVLMPRIKSYYLKNDKPSKLDIITTGHSLGGALAELTAYSYKTKFLEEFRDIVSPENITVKTYTFGAPAIVNKTSKDIFEGALGKENIFRVWTLEDPLVRLSNNLEISPLLGTFVLLDTVHVGRSIPLYNIQNHNFGNASIGPARKWKDHLAPRYLSFLHSLANEYETPQFKELDKALNNYIKAKSLDVYKIHEKTIREVKEKLDADTLPPSFLIDRELAKRIIKYTPTTIKLITPVNVNEALQSADSPRYTASLSPRFTVEESGNLYSYETNSPRNNNINANTVRVKRTSNRFYNRHEITATFRIEGQIIDFPIYKDTPCTMQAVKQFLNHKGFYLSDEDIQPLSCGAFLAKHIFVSQYVTFPSYYYGVAGIRNIHLDTLTKIYQGCVDEKVCTPQFLIQTSNKKSPLKQALDILTHVGLGEAFKEKQLDFTRYEAQDKLRGDIRHGEELVKESKSPLRLDRNLLLRLIQPIDITQENADIFNDERQILYKELCNATNYEDHWNRFMGYLDINEFRNLIFSDVVRQEHPFRVQAFENFKNNLDHVLIFANPSPTCTPTCLNIRPPIHQPSLIQDLNRLKREVLGEVVVAS